MQVNHLQQQSILETVCRVLAKVANASTGIKLGATCTLMLLSYLITLADLGKRSPLPSKFAHKGTLSSTATIEADDQATGLHDLLSRKALAVLPSTDANND